LRARDPLFVGLMSGTSVDAIDCALARCDDDAFELIATHEHAIPPGIRERVAALSHPGADEINRMGVLDRELGRLFAEATLALLAAARTEPDSVLAIGCHGQTIRHHPPSLAGGDRGFTLQIGDPGTIAEGTGITTIADFRSRDIAAGGEGAPLAPAFHAAVLARAGVNRAIVNIGGIANVTFLQGTELKAGFDTGPGNTLLDHWIADHSGKSCDVDGQWSATGQVHEPLLARLLAHPYFTRSGPRSTGKEAFNLPWLEAQLATVETVPPEDVQATLVELTSTSIAEVIRHYPLDVEEIYVCGGGAHNSHLMGRLAGHLAPVAVNSTSSIGMDPDWVEAATFAWLARRTLHGLTGSCPAVTGARGPRILGGIYRAAPG
jgi:anhydro-N-acetylmuramic acid kinase